jgi:hypothetical protein
MPIVKKAIAYARRTVTKAQADLQPGSSTAETHDRDQTGGPERGEDPRELL